MDLSFKPLGRHFPWQLLTDVCHVLHIGRHGYHKFHKHSCEEEPVVPFQPLFCVAMCQVCRLLLYNIHIFFKFVSHLECDAREPVLLTSAVISTNSVLDMQQRSLAGNEWAMLFFCGLCISHSNWSARFVFVIVTIATCTLRKHTCTVLYKEGF